MSLLKSLLKLWNRGSADQLSAGADSAAQVRPDHDLPSFKSLEEAEEALFQSRDQDLETLKQLAATQSQFVMDYTPESIINLEAWYFALHECDGFKTLNIECSDFERCMAMYFGAVSVQNVQEASWIVRPY